MGNLLIGQHRSKILIEQNVTILGRIGIALNFGLIRSVQMDLD